jgi:hypothetical protein
MLWREYIKISDYVISQALSLGKSPPTLGALLSCFTLFYLNKLSCYIHLKKKKKAGKAVQPRAPQSGLMEANGASELAMGTSPSQMTGGR